jgi:hypothetical protein
MYAVCDSAVRDTSERFLTQPLSLRDCALVRAHITLKQHLTIH